MENLPDFYDSFASISGIAMVLVIAFTSYVLLKRSLLLLQKKKDINDHVIDTARKFIFWTILLLTILFTLQQMGVQVSSIISALLAVAAMIAVGFIAVWSVLSNLLCALLLIIFRPFQIGDEIEITEPVGGSCLRGKVLKYNVMYTTLLEKIEETEYITNVPNNIFFQKTIRRKSDDGYEG